MNLEDTLASLKEAFTGKSAEAETFSKELADTKALVESKDAELKVALGLSDSLKADKSALEAKVAALEGELTKANELAAAAIAAQKAAESKIESAGKKAAEIAASVGVDEPVEVSPVASESAKSNDDLAAEWASLRQTDAKAASDFYTKHRSAILAAAGLR